jgi:hypothetical protein
VNIGMGEALQMLLLDSAVRDIATITGQTDRHACPQVIAACCVHPIGVGVTRG